MARPKTGHIVAKWWMKPSTRVKLGYFAERAECRHGSGVSVGEFLDLLADGEMAQIGDEWIIKFPKK